MHSQFPLVPTRKNIRYRTSSTYYYLTLILIDKAPIGRHPHTTLTSDGFLTGFSFFFFFFLPRGGAAASPFPCIFRHRSWVVHSSFYPSFYFSRSNGGERGGRAIARDRGARVREGEGHRHFILSNFFFFSHPLSL